MTNTQIAEQIEAAKYRQLVLNCHKRGMSIAESVRIRIAISLDFCRDSAEDPRAGEIY